ncbi:MAG: hypothetical protein CVU94_03920 [Firmicutes bacterium HGW-Firmicutes-19]|jgi:hypothetical protein|nr:MAG: hypothetical protein CVU94_03920 [Firmicutes bacterium HGW-Firmicutes-19]
MIRLTTTKILVFTVIVFLLSMIMFYYIFLVITPVPLTLENHFGFFIWSFLPAFILAFSLFKRRWIGFTILFVAMISASSSLIHESIVSTTSGTGNLGAVLSYILIMIFSFVTAIIIEGTLWIIRLIRNKLHKR